MLRGDYIYFNILTSAVSICLLLYQALILNSVAKLLTSHLPLDSSCRKVMRLNPKSDQIDLWNSDAEASCVFFFSPLFFGEDMREVNYVCKEKVEEKIIRLQRIIC